MTEFIFTFLQQVGFTHPLHPASTHIPMGMAMGCFFFGIAALVWPGKHFSKTAFHCSLLGLLFIVPAAIAGILDWQHRFEGKLGTLIIVKMILAVVLTGSFLVAIKWKYEERPAKTMLLIYGICLLAASGLGFFGGELQYG
jgi:uncharacterized membrane protein